MRKKYMFKITEQNCIVVTSILHSIELGFLRYLEKNNLIS